jgi:hypothetical protein
MPLEIKALEDSDYENILCKWWKDWDWEAPPKDFLPDNGKGGLIVYDGDTPVCAGFMYVTNSAVSWVDWIISNKQYRKKPDRAEALTMLIDSLTNICKNTGSKFAYALIKHNSLLETYKELGYIEGDSYNKEMIKAF